MKKYLLKIIFVFGIFLLFFNAKENNPLQNRPEADVSCQISDAGASFSGLVQIHNKGSVPIKMWSLEFDWDWQINPASVWCAKLSSHSGNHYVFSCPDWGTEIAPGSVMQFGFSGPSKGNQSRPANLVLKDESSSGGNDPAEPGAELYIKYKTVSQSASQFEGHVTIQNPNTAYLWNGNCFTIRNIQFETNAVITNLKSTNGAVSYTIENGVVFVDLGWQNILPLGKKVELIIQGQKTASTNMPSHFKANYVRGKDIIYPQYGKLPATWSKGKTNLSAADLIHDQAAYYNSQLDIVQDNFIMYQPNHSTQIQIGQVYAMDYPVNTVNGVRIWIPCPLMAMGLGYVYEIFKINPNYMAALGTKENYAAGVVDGSAGNLINPVTIDGKTYYWPIVAHGDGPYQQETGNFSDVVKYFADFFPPAPQHDDYTAIKVDFNDPHWISSAISSAISITVTRETLNAIDVNYNEFMQQALDPWAEFSVVTYAYNRGINAFYTKKIFTTHRARALAATDIVAEFGMGGFASHVPTVRAITRAMNRDLSDIYDAQIQWSDMEVLFSQLRKFYPPRVINQSDWNLMQQDVQRAFQVLSAHWAGNWISFRYDYLTLIRVIKEHLPQPSIPRPTGEDWYYLIKNATP